MKKNILMRKLLDKKNTICLENEEEKGINNRILEIPEYKENLEFEVLESFSEKIKCFIESNDYQKVIEFTEKQLYFLNLISDSSHFSNFNFNINYNKNDKKIDDMDFHFELPLKRQNNEIIGNINELIINEKLQFRNFFTYLKQELLSCKKFYFIVSFIRYSGIQLLISVLDELEEKGDYNFCLFEYHRS